MLTNDKKVEDNNTIKPELNFKEKRTILSEYYSTKVKRLLYLICVHIIVK